jgi:hypothetical protein
MAGAHDTVDV